MIREKRTLEDLLSDPMMGERLKEMLLQERITWKRESI
jgi:hypothetical protein